MIDAMDAIRPDKRMKDLGYTEFSLHQRRDVKFDERITRYSMFQESFDPEKKPQKEFLRNFWVRYAGLALPNERDSAGTEPPVNLLRGVITT